MSPHTLQYLLPLLLIVPIALLRARKLSRKQPLKLGLLWLRPAILVLVCGLVLLFPQPGLPPHPLVASDWAVLAAAALAGGIGGWQLGRTMAIEVHPEDGTLMVKASPIGILVLLGLILGRTALRAGSEMEAALWHVDPVLVFDGLIVFTAALFAVRSVEMYLRAKKVMAAARGA